MATERTEVHKGCKGRPEKRWVGSGWPTGGDGAGQSFKGQQELARHGAE